MAGFEPLVVDNGQIQQVAGQRVELKRINLGPLVTINVTSNTVTMTQSLHFLQGGGGPIQNVDNILGGLESDLLIVGGNNVRLRSVGNLDLQSNLILQPGRSVTLLFVASQWFEISRRT